MKYTKEENINIIALIKIILSQNFKITRPRKLAKIIILSSWMLAFIIIKIYYCTKLWDFMTFSKYDRTIETIDELFQTVSDGKIKILVENYKSDFYDHIKVIIIYWGTCNF